MVVKKAKYTLKFERGAGIVGHFPVPYPADSLRSQKIVPDDFFEPPFIYIEGSNTSSQ